MKKRILIWAMLLVTGLSGAYANNTANTTGVSDQVIASFQKDFASAQEVNWETGRDYSKATFKLNGQVLFAYYSNNAELVAVTRNILSSQLPLSLMTDLKKGYGKYWITDLFEMASNNETSYYVSMENADYRLVLKSVGTNRWEVYRKEKKADL